MREQTVEQAQELRGLEFEGVGGMTAHPTSPVEATGRPESGGDN